ncbi:hypothetical protein AGDE_12911 [Angomonas deanei]|nr:hypothetical protein AGDE_12911 [Angomonas deanei]|eukprot:EPY23297.1 hypothetical protein AGDE_12911 [Angomonas deanei]
MEADELLRQIHALLTSAGLVHLPRKSWHHGGARFTGPVYKSIFSATSGCSLDFAGMPPRQFADTLVALQMLIQGLQLEKCSSSMTVDMVGARNLLLSFGLEMYMHPESITESYLPPLEAMVFSTTTTDETVIFLLDHSDDHPRLSWEVLCTSFLFPKATPIIVCRPHVLDETSIVGEVETVEHGVCFSVPCEPAAVEAFHQFKTNKSVRRVYGTVRNGLCTAVSDSYPVLF